MMSSTIVSGPNSSHPSETVTTLGWSRDGDAVSSAAAVHAIRYFDRNSGRAADAWHLARVAHGARGSLSVGAAVSYRDTDESRLRVVDNEQRYDPYWTPEELLEILQEFRRIAAPDAVMSHTISLDDQYAAHDPGITPFNFLRFSDRAWRCLAS